MSILSSRWRIGFCVASTVAMIAAGCARRDAALVNQSTLPLPSVAATQPTNLSGVHNVVAFSPKLYSGSVPEGEAGFKTLRAMGIKTIISVDGMQPDVDGAQAEGMRYVHLPIGYNGMDRTRTLELARAVRDLPGPIYLHCHHGKHRSAAAAAAVEVTLGQMTSEDGIAHMKIAGTAPAYAGLFKCVQTASPASEADLDSADASFPARYKTGSTVQTMVEIDNVSDHLKAIEKAGWKTPANHPDLVPVAEAARLADLFRDLTQDKAPVCREEGYQQILATTAKQTSDLETTLAQPTPDAARLSTQFKSITQSCTTCHEQYRN